ncbi:MAG: type II toxin-antitoxin system RelE/ParE family toxin [Acidimicrobiia bacterium]
MGWEIVYSENFTGWWDDLTAEQQEALTGRILLLQERGPDLGRPVVERIQGSRYQNMKELRASKDGALRVLFIFDPRRRAVFLVGGDKTGQWKQWYREAIPAAEERYEEFLRDEGLI